jgi:hypothetical protein
MDIIPKPEDEDAILEEIRDHAAYWRSDRCKLATVITHLNGSTPCHPNRLGIADVEAKIQWLVAVGKLEILPSRNSDYIKIKRTE